MRQEWWNRRLTMLTRRLATAGFLVVTLLVALGGSARAAPGFMCEEIEDSALAMTVGPELEVFGPERAPAPAIAAALALTRDPRERFLCWGNPLTDDPSCWSNDPAGSPRPSPVFHRVVRDTAIMTSLALPEPATARVPFAGLVLAATHPGYARGVDRPPRRAA